MHFQSPVLVTLVTVCLWSSLTNTPTGSKRIDPTSHFYPSSLQLAIAFTVQMGKWEKLKRLEEVTKKFVLLSGTKSGDSCTPN